MKASFELSSKAKVVPVDFFVNSFFPPILPGSHRRSASCSNGSNVSSIHSGTIHAKEIFREAMKTRHTLPKRILIVDDDQSVREMLSRVLEGEGYHTVRAADGAEALDIVAVMPIDLVLLDLNLPGKSG